jgi:hypothetical protein
MLHLKGILSQSEDGSMILLNIGTLPYHFPMHVNPEDGGSMILRNIGILHRFTMRVSPDYEGSMVL